MTEFQAAILLAQLGRVKDQTATRSKNATYLSRELSGISGIDPLRIPRFVTTHAYHLYILRYDAEAFRGPPRDIFVKALRAEGIPCSAGYRPLYKEEFVKKAIETRAFQKLFGRSRLNKYLSDIHCPMTEKACNEQAVWIPQPVLLGTKKDMNNIVEAIQKIHRYGEELNKTHHQ
jgi:dTDP-4-amino-4,6-dideoxygalactose transaminase